MALTGHRKKRNLIGRDNHVRSVQPPMSANTTLECITRYSGEYTCTSTTRENQNEVVKFKDMDVFHMYHNIHSIQNCFGIYTLSTCISASLHILVSCTCGPLAD